MGHIVKADNAQLKDNYISEIKGSDKELTLKGVVSLAVKIDKIYFPTPPLKGSSSTIILRFPAKLMR